LGLQLQAFLDDRGGDKGRQEHGEMDPAVVLSLRRQSGAPSTVRAGIQPGELPASFGAAKGGEALVADDAAGEAHQDRGEGRHARAVRYLPASRGRRTPMALPGHPGTYSAAPTAGTGAGMTATTVETAGGRGGDGDGLRGSTMNASTQAALGRIMTRKRPNYLAGEQRRHLRTSRSVV